MTTQEERVIERLSGLQELIAQRDPKNMGQPTYAFYDRIEERLKNIIMVMRLYGIDPEQSTKLKTTLCKLVERIERESRIEALELYRALVIMFDELEYFSFCWQVYCTVKEIHQARLFDVLPSHLKSAVTLMS